MRLGEHDLSAAQYWALLEMATEGVWRWDVVHDKVTWSPALLATLGYSQEEMTKLDVINLTHPADRQRHLDAIESHLTKGGVYEIEVRMRCEDGAYQWFMARGMTEFAPDKTPLVMIGFIVSMQDTHKNEDRLFLSEARFRAFMDNCPAGVYLKDSDSVHLYLNRAASVIVGAPLDELIGATTDDIFDPETAAEVKEVDRKVLEQRKLVTWTGKVNKEDEPEQWVHDVKFPVRLEDGRIAVGGFALDITESRDRQAALEAAKRMETVGQLAGGIAHDFNNMLNVISGNVELAMSQLSRDHRVYGNLNEVMLAVERSAAMTKQLLGFARKQVRRPIALDLAHEIGRMMLILDRLVGDDIVVTRDFSEVVWPVSMDPTQVDQVLTNLVINAKDAMRGSGGTICVSVKNSVVDAAFAEVHPDFEPGTYVRLSVTDNGSGIKSDNMHRLFEPFFTTKDEGEGSGLGLATTYGIVRQNNGHILVDSEVGNGTTFSIYFPSLTDQEAVIPTGSSSESPHGSGERVLIVEDEAPLLRVLKEMLESLAYSVETASSADEAISKIEKSPQPFDLLISDVVMPGNNGIELATQVKEKRPEVRVLLMSGHARGEPVADQRTGEHFEFIQKPLDRNSLAAKVRQLLA